MKEQTCRHCKYCEELGVPYWYDHLCTVLVADGGEPMPILRHQIDVASVCEEWIEKTEKGDRCE